MDPTAQRILLTGGAGFLGQHVHQALLGRGCRRGTIEEGLGRTNDYPHGPTHFLHQRPAEPALAEPAAYTVRSKTHDLTDRDACRGLALGLQPHLVIHMAALTGGIGANRATPAEFLLQNLLMGTQLLHECWKAGTRKFVGIGSVCAYPKHAPVPFREESLWDGYPEETNAPYGLAKRMLLVQSQAYRQQYGFNAIHLLPTNLYGPGDNFHPDKSHVIPALILKFVLARDRGQPEVTVWGTGRATREFLYVTDAAEAVVLAAERYDDPEPINIGTGLETSISALVELIRELVGYRGEVRWDRTKPDGQPRRCLDTTRATNALGFKPLVDLRTGLANTIEWFERRLYPTVAT